MLSGMSIGVTHGAGKKSQGQQESHHHMLSAQEDLVQVMASGKGRDKQ